MSDHRKGTAMQPRSLFVVTAMLEAGTGLALGLAPSMLVVILVGAPPVFSGGVVVARVAGAAPFSLGAACMAARRDAQSQA